MPFHYFLPIPKLASEVRDHTGAVELLEWLAAERASLKRGQAVARVQTRWAVLELLAASDGVLGKQIFEPGAQILEGDPIAVIYADGESLPYGRERVDVRISTIRQPKPQQRSGRPSEDAT